MVTLGSVECTNMVLMFYAVSKMIRQGFFWQIGNTVRDNMPYHVAVIELQTVDMKGFVHSLRRRLEHDIMSPKIFQLDPFLVERRGITDMMEKEDEILKGYHLDMGQERPKPGGNEIDED
jgi:hypothetical protein